MRDRPFFAQRPPLFTADDLARIEEAALRILDESGIAVLDEALLAQLASLGFRARGDRVFIEPATTREFIDGERQRNGDRFAEGPLSDPPSTTEITVSVSQYPLHVHDLDTDRIVPFTVDRLIEASKLLDVLADRGVASSPPGGPTDAPPALQPVLQYWVAATCSRQGRRPPDPKAEVTLPHVARMADLLGHPIRHLPVYVFSPLTLGGESLRCVLCFRDRLDSVGVSSMPSAGCTAPLHVGDAFALAAAEIIGSAILVREALDLPVHWHIALFPIDLRTMAMVFGSPEALLFELAGREVQAYFAGAQWSPAADNLHTNAKLPGAQACAEKSSIMTTGALLGSRHFGSVGTLSLDEAFSAEQLLYDLEIKDHVERLLRGIDGACDPERCAAEVAEGLCEKSFAGLDATLEGYRDLYWHPRLFNRQFLGAWQTQGARSIREETHAMVRDLLSQHEYRLEPDLQAELDGLVDRAKRELA